MSKNNFLHSLAATSDEPTIQDKLELQGGAYCPFFTWSSKPPPLQPPPLLKGQVKKHVLRTSYQMCRRGWRNGRKNVHAHLIHYRQFSRRICAHSIWQLFSTYGVRWCTGQPWTLGYCRPRRLRQAETAFISSDWCFSNLFFCGVTVLLWKCHFQMVPRDQTSLCRCANLTHRYENWLKGRQRNIADPSWKRTGTHQEGTGSKARKQNSRSQVPRVFGIDTKRAKTGFRRGCPSSS